MKRLVYSLLIVALLLVPSLAAAQAPAPEKAPAASPAAPPVAPPAAAPAPQQPQMQCVPGPGGTCPMPGQMSPEQMKQVQAKCCAMMQEGKGCPMHQQMQKQVDELRQRVEALEKQKGKKK